jgi:hypothetical protein
MCCPRQEKIILSLSLIDAVDDERLTTHTQSVSIIV